MKLNEEVYKLYNNQVKTYVFNELEHLTYNEDENISPTIQLFNKLGYSENQLLNSTDFIMFDALLSMMGYETFEEKKLYYIDIISEYLEENFEDMSIKDVGYYWYKPKLVGTWQAYMSYLKNKGFAEKDIDSIDNSTNKVLTGIEDPKSPREFSQKGLVIGEIQSGKTANFTGLIAKMIDSGVDYIIILAGIHNALRNQTQKRLESDIIGRTQNENGRYIDCGISLFDNKYSANAQVVTSSNNDLKSSDFRDLDQSGEKTKIFVIKKNVNTLRTLKRLLDSVEREGKSLMMIDDEADNASIDTNYNNDEKDETVTNSSIRTMLTMFDKSYYIAYTATPYANLFIDKQSVSEKLNEDLFPSDFIIKLKSSEKYTGYDKYFNTAYTPQIVQEINVDNDEYDMLDEAVLDYLVSAAIKYHMYCGESAYSSKHSTMLIHISHMKIEHDEQVSRVSRIFDELSTKILFLNDKEQLEKIKLSVAMKNDAYRKITGEISNITDEQVIRILKMMLSEDRFKITKKNSDASEDLDYSGEYMNYIVVGGNTLSRGLTLEGLITSYFGRVSNSMDTLSQMGRWYGYRLDYLHLTKVFITPEAKKYFDEIATCDALIEEQLNEMNAANESPQEFLFKISNFGALNPTSNAKLGAARKTSFSFSGDSPQITGIDTTKYLASINTINQLFNKYSNSIEELGGAFRIKKVSSEILLNFLYDYKQINDNPILYTMRTDISNWIKYIEEKNIVNELANWTIVIKGVKSSDDEEKFVFGKLGFATRSMQKIPNQSDDLLRAKIISSPQDESYDFDTIFDNRIEAREHRDSKDGLLVIYLLKDKQSRKEGLSLSISYPYTKNDINESSTGYIN